MRDENCIFCKIAGGEIPSTTLYEDDDFRVILDLGPATRGHALLIPKEHYRDLFDLEDEVAEKVLLRARRIAGRMKEALGADGFNLVQNNGKAAGQTVFHFHMHLIPRYENDHAGILWKPGETTPEELEEVKRLVDGQ
ncbi:MAG: HIT family protein [Lachnospiraceae bacterium]